MAKRWIAPEFGGVEVFEFVETTVPEPRAGEVTISVRAAGVNPADYKHTQGGPNADRSQLPMGIGYEVAGVISAIGPGTTIASGGGSTGDRVIAFRVDGGYATDITVPAHDVFAAPDTLDDAAAANLFLAGTTAADVLRVVHPGEGDTVLVHGASGSVGVSVLQQARQRGIRLIGTASEANAETVRRFGGEPVAYGEGLADRVRALAPEGVAAAIDCVGTDEAVDVSLELVVDRDRIVTIAAHGRAQRDGFRAVGGAQPESAAFRDSVRQQLVDMAASGELVVPVARTWPLADAVEALRFLQEGHPGGKLALVP
ncbi:MULTISPECIES: NADP-dependent oxidoreductase [unclassified Curtobacterium]|uniref:NADP-dependent oxidoreductase n=1 Tax=unclassified Curtobacterium TaxID=257496 RepID=UPI000DA6F8EE|nr:MULTISPECIES: NADP-dependent oxidoreductase [unclassified Curtobacterium]PZE75155.1 NADP-dependent oxidoreductase [Curtobacterium sp. MCBD17_019]WIE56198.1 NADP-dependent oxidoreductase [Curtobacterium sp. MCBD17_003]